MKLPKLSVKRPVATSMVFMAILLLGLVSLRMLTLDVMPAMELPSLTVLTVYPGASADEVEDQVTKLLEATLSGAQDLKKIKSVSRENVSIISMEYNWGSDITLAANNARDLMELTRSRLPDDARDPVIYKVNSSMMPVLIYSVTADDNYEGLGQIIDDKIASVLRKTKGVGTVFYLGQPEREIKIHINPDRIKAYNLSIAGIATVLKAENISIPAGNIKMGSGDYSIRIPSDITSTEELADIPLMNVRDKLVRLSDVADIEDSYLETDEYASTEDGPGVVVMVQKQSGENSLEVIKAVRAEMKNIKKGLANDIRVNEILSQEEIISQSIKSLTDTLWLAILFVIIVVIAFLREWRSSLIISLTIPFSLITAFIFMYMKGWTINVFSLLSLIIAIGMVVDDAIVILENITQHISKGENPREAAVSATGEMGLAVVTSTATVLIVFIPLMFVGGIVGIFFKQLAVLTTVTLVASLIIAFSLTPMLSSKLLKKADTDKSKKDKFSIYKMSEKHLVAAENIYKNILGWAVNHKVMVIVSAVLLLAVSAFGLKNIESDYLPIFDAGDIIVVFQTEVGTNAEETHKTGKKVMQVLKENIPEIVPGTMGSISGQTRDGLLSMVGFSEGKNVGTVLCHLTLPDERDRSASEIGEMIRGKLEEIPEIVKFHVTSGNILEAAVLGNEKPIEIKVSGNDLDKINNVADQIKERIGTIQGLTSVESSADAGKTEYQVIIDRKKASEAGLNSGMIALQVRQSIYGAEAGTISDGGEDYGIMIRYAPENMSEISDINNIVLTTLLGTQVKLSEVADIRQDFGPLEISRESQQRYVKVSCDLLNTSLSKAKQMVTKALAEMDTPEDVSISIEGQVNSQKESFSDLTLVLILGILLVYMIMAALFESFKGPFIIMLALPFTAIGIIIAFLITNTTLSITTFIGIIMLVGIVVKNGVILVDYTNMLRKRGYKLYDAVKEAGRSRLRPVVMTSLTVILAMIPMAFSKSMGYEMFSPMAITMIGGLLFSMIITLIIVPVFYASFNRDKSKNEV